jgi:tRNA U38,U39,U40 pseudouridine synthase TruA
VLELEITANSFPRHMVRTLVGTMLSARRMSWSVCLQDASAEASSTAPPSGLYLVKTVTDTAGV